MASLIVARGRAALVPGLLCLALLGGCASTGNPRDPIEPVNRAIYHFNDGLDHLLLKPAAEIYEGVLPQFARTGINNFFDNLYDVRNALNNLLQGKFLSAASDVGRIAINSTVGLAGFLDLATEIGFERHKEDFGQTLGWWGLGDGAYLQLPFFGASSVRDAVGLLGDFTVDPVRYIWRHHIPTRNSVWGLGIVNLRATLLDSTKLLQEAALDEYEFQRDAYLQRRRSLVYDGNPPKEEDELPDVKVKPRSEADEPKQPGATLGVLEREPAVETADLPPRAQEQPAAELRAGTTPPATSAESPVTDRAAPLAI